MVRWLKIAWRVVGPTIAGMAQVAGVCGVFFALGCIFIGYIDWPLRWGPDPVVDVVVSAALFGVLLGVCALYLVALASGVWCLAWGPRFKEALKAYPVASQEVA